MVFVEVDCSTNWKPEKTRIALANKNNNYWLLISDKLNITVTYLDTNSTYATRMYKYRVPTYLCTIILSTLRRAVAFVINKL